MKNKEIYKDNNSNDNMNPGDPHGLPDEFFYSQIFIDGAFLSKLNKHLGSDNYIRFDRELSSKDIFLKFPIIKNQK